MVRIVVRIGFGCGGGGARGCTAAVCRFGVPAVYGGLGVCAEGSGRSVRSPLSSPEGRDRGFAAFRPARTMACCGRRGGCIRRGCLLRRCSGKLEGLSAIRRELSLRPNEHEVILLRTEEIRMVFLTYSAANRMCRDARSSRRRIDSRLRQDVFDGSRYGLFEPEIRSTEDPPVFTMRSSGCSFVIESPMACLPAGVLRRGRWKESGALPKPVSALP